MMKYVSMSIDSVALPVRRRALPRPFLPDHVRVGLPPRGPVQGAGRVGRLHGRAHQGEGRGHAGRQGQGSRCAIAFLCQA